MRNQIIGLWVSVPENPTSTIPFEKHTFEFKKNGELILTYYTTEKKSLILLTYEIEGDQLITDQPSHPKIETSTFRVSNKILEIESDEGKTAYRKITLAEKLCKIFKRRL